MGQRPIVAIVSNALTPYRLALHRRIIREIPEIELRSLFTHGEGDSRWSQGAPADINPVEFGVGESASKAGLGQSLHEWWKAKRIVRWLRDHEAAAVVVLGYSDLGRIRMLRWCRKNRVPVFLFGDSNIRDDDARGGLWRRRLKRWLLPRILKWCDGVLTCGSLGVAYFQRYGVSTNRIFLFPYEPDYSLIANIQPAQVSAVRHRFQLDLQRRRIIYSGRLVEAKRVDLLLDAFAAISAQRPDWDLVIAGAGRLESALKSRELVSVTKRVQWLGFVDDSSILSALYKACDVLVLPSAIEPWAVVINEAVAAGLAVVASDAVGAAVELVRDGVNGRIFPSGDLQELTRALFDTTDPSRCQQYRAGAPSVLADWRRSADPIAGLRGALRQAGVLAART